MRWVHVSVYVCMWEVGVGVTISAIKTKILKCKMPEMCDSLLHATHCVKQKYSESCRIYPISASLASFGINQTCQVPGCTNFMY